jgi:ribosomal protein S18 acetylase RimI-like enzyme
MSNLNEVAGIVVKTVDFAQPLEASAWIDLLDMYARDPMGGGQGLDEHVKARLPIDLAGAHGGVHLMAWNQAQAVGLLNAFLGYSTFKAKPLMNIHDIAVKPQWRGRGVGQSLLASLELLAKAQGCCKLTLEVLSGNTKARAAYEHFGFEDYALDPGMGAACFMQKWL